MMNIYGKALQLLLLVQMVQQFFIPYSVIILIINNFHKFKKTFE